MKLYVGFGTVHLQKETFYFLHKNAFKTYKNDLKTTQNPQKQPTGGVLKKSCSQKFRKISRTGPVSVSIF